MWYSVPFLNTLQYDFSILFQLLQLPIFYFFLSLSFMYWFGFLFVIWLFWYMFCYFVIQLGVLVYLLLFRYSIGSVGIRFVILLFWYRICYSIPLDGPFLRFATRNSFHVMLALATISTFVSPCVTRAFNVFFALSPCALLPLCSSFSLPICLLNNK